jgi:hypothetical protein
MFHAVWIACQRVLSTVVTCSYYNTGWSTTGLLHFLRVSCLKHNGCCTSEHSRHLLLARRRRGTQNNRWPAFSDWVSARKLSFLACSYLTRTHLLHTISHWLILLLRPQTGSRFGRIPNSWPEKNCATRQTCIMPFSQLIISDVLFHIQKV